MERQKRRKQRQEMEMIIGGNMHQSRHLLQAKRLLTIATGNIHTYCPTKRRNLLKVCMQNKTSPMNFIKNGHSSVRKPCNYAWPTQISITGCEDRVSIFTSCCVQYSKCGWVISTLPSTQIPQIVHLNHS